MFVNSDVLSIFDVAVPPPSQVLVAGEIRQVALKQLEEEEREQCYEKQSSVPHDGLLSDIIHLILVFCEIRHKIAVKTYQKSAESVG